MINRKLKMVEGIDKKTISQYFYLCHHRGNVTGFRGQEHGIICSCEITECINIALGDCHLNSIDSVLMGMKKITKNISLMALLRK